MKIKERFIKCKNKYDEYYILPVVDDAEQLVKIADEFVIGFMKWFYENAYLIEWLSNNHKREQLLEAYKKTL